jgi:plasmid stabilization system protein ParE
VPDYEITAPDGKKFRVSGPGTREEALAQVQAQYQPQLRPGQSGKFSGPIATGQEMAESRTAQTMRKLGLLENARLTMGPLGRAGLGAAEAAASIGTGMVAAPANFAWNAAMEAGELPTGQPVGTYIPRTPEGQGILSGADKAMRLTGLPQAIERGMDLENPDPAKRATGNAIGAVLGVMPGYGSMVARRSRRAAIPTRAEIKTAAGDAYQRAEQAGGMLPQSNLGGFVQQAEQVLAKEGFDRQLNPATYAAVQRFYDEATKPGIAGHSAQGAEVLRRVLLNAEKQAGPGTQDAMLAGKLVDEFDDFMDTQALPATPEYAQARALWQTQRKAQDIEQLFERAQNTAGQYSVSGMENALRVQFKQLADNPKRFGRFNAEEKEAILRVVRGGPIQYGLRLLGKFAPTGTVPALASIAAEGVAPGSGLALAGVGIAGRAGASALRNRSARRVDEMVRSGAIPNMPASRMPGSRQLPQLGYIPANALATREAAEQERRRNALAR